MKLMSEVEEWALGAAAQFGDPAVPVCQIFAKYEEGEDIGHDYVTARYTDRLLLELDPGNFLPLPIHIDGPQINDAGALKVFGIAEICPGVWTLNPSLNIPGLIHAFITIYSVPIYAPWAKRIIIPAGVHV